MKQQVVFLAMLLIIGLMAPAVVATEATIGFSDFVAGVSPTSNTSLGADTFWRTYRNQKVIWSADVVEVKGSRRGAEIYLADAAQPLYRGYNIVLVVADRNAAGVLKRGDRLHFEGNLNRYKANPGAPVVVYLSNGKLLDATTTAEPPAAEKTAESFAAFVALLSSDQNTEIAARSNWARLQHQTVTWQATVVDVKGGRRAADVYLAAPGAPVYRGYNVILDNTDLNRASLLKKGQSVTVRGLPARFTYRKARPVVVTLRQGEISAD